mmetsp:Transcript_51515/g.125641  ORF Transcript_51515/g.125641 Transcript_51515/m.125641 type:complete len:421 (+) Transcript_51515:184-1446(+)
MAEHLSRRGHAVSNPPLSEYIREHFARAGQDSGQSERPYIGLCVAENRSMWEVLTPQLARYRDVPPRVLGYDSMIGSLDFRHKLAAFMGRAFLGRAIKGGELAVVAGAGAVLELLFHVLADPGDGVLIPTPSYAGFWTDLENRDQLRAVPVHCSSEDGFELRVEALERARLEAEKSGIPIKALIFTSPNNPLGWVYTREQLEAVLTWAESAHVHVVFDEIYALSVFGKPFVSAAAVRASLGPMVHVVWAFSKDFGASGLRCGVLWSENPAVLAGVDALAYWAACSGDTQHLLGSLVSDTPFVDGYITRMRARLGESYAAVTAALDAHNVPHVKAEAGFFLICDLRKWLPEQTFAGEAKLWRRLIDKANVNLTPGSACRISEPGFFRLCYASEAVPTVLEAVRRIGSVLAGRGAPGGRALL